MATRLQVQTGDIIYQRRDGVLVNRFKVTHFRSGKTGKAELVEVPLLPDDETQTLLFREYFAELGPQPARGSDIPQQQFLLETPALKTEWEFPKLEAHVRQGLAALSDRPMTHDELKRMQALLIELDILTPIPTEDDFY